MLEVIPLKALKDNYVWTLHDGTHAAVVDPGEEVVIFEPFYENYGPDAIICGAVPRFVRLRPPDWTFDPDELAAAFNERTRAIILDYKTGRAKSAKERKDKAADGRPQRANGNLECRGWQTAGDLARGRALRQQEQLIADRAGDACRRVG